MSTKKGFYITLLILLLSTGHSIAQKLDGGLYVGLHTSQVTGDGHSGYNKFGTYAGAFVSIPFNRKFGLNLELSYIQKGSKELIDENSSDPFPYYIKTNYMEIPICLYWHIEDFIIEGGLTGGVLVYGEDGDLSSNNYSSEFNPIEIGGLLSLSYPISNHLRIKLRINNSILPFRGESSGGSYRFLQGQYQHGLSCTLNYHFND